jgi:TonB-dependent receptor
MPNKVQSGMISMGMGTRLLAGVSMVALGFGAVPAYAQAADKTKPESASTSTDTKDAKAQAIVVTGVRAALQSARARKKNADTVMDSITATDIGAFPDKSVAEALQRVPGITVTRFAISTDTAHFTTEPSGVLVRGLPQVRNEFNGRDTFSANGGRALSWGDVPAELLGGVDVYKNQTADLIEGGIAGSVDLRTRLPFDVTGQVVEVGIKENWGDIAKKFTPDANVYYSNRWQTGVGEFGIMGDIAYSHVKTGSLGLTEGRAGIFEGGMIPGTSNITSVFGKGAVAIPNGLSMNDDRFDRKRTGIAAAVQWKSNDHKWLATAQYIRSNYNNQMSEHSIGTGGYIGFPSNAPGNYRFTPGSSGAPVPAPGSPDFTFGSDGLMNSGTPIQSGGWWGSPFDSPGGNTPGGDGDMALNSNGQPMIHSCYSWSGQPASYCPAGYNVHSDGFNTGTRIQQNKDMTQEAALNLKYDPTNNLHLNFDGQYVQSHTTFYDASIGFGSWADPVLSGLSTDPRIVSLNPPSNVDLSPGGLANPDNYTISSFAPQIQNNRGHELAFRADGQWEVPGQSWIDTLKFGARYSDREQLVRQSDYDWNNIGNTWTNGCQYLYYNLDAKPGTCAPSSGPATVFNGYPAGLYDVEKFGDPYFGGTLGNFPFVPISFLNAHGLDLLSKKLTGIGSFLPICERDGTQGGSSGGTVDLPGSCYSAHEIANISEKTKAAYLMAKFGSNGDIMLGGVKISGNVGIRYVETEDKSSGYEVFPTITQNPATSCPATPLVPGGLTGNAPTPPAGLPGQPATVPYNAICYLSPADQKFASGGGTAQPLSSNVTHHDVLPSFNLRFDFSPKWLARFAVSRAISRPDMALLKNYVSISETLANTSNPNDPLWIKDSTGKIIGETVKYLGTADNPTLKPESAWQFDVSIENYFGNAGMFSFDLFYKSFANYIQSGLFFANFTNNGVTRTVQVNGPANGKGAKIEGFEVAYNRFFDFLPKPLDGLGVQTNFTYIKNKGVPNSNLQTFFPTAGSGNVPALDPGSLEGLSKYSFNIVGLYERPNFPLSLRLAYNWRSRYLITAADCCVGLPIWQKAAGYLDGSIRYSINTHFELSLEASNLLNTKTVNLQQVADSNSPEGKTILLPVQWFRQDRRFMLGFRWKM